MFAPRARAPSRGQRTFRWGHGPATLAAYEPGCNGTQQTQPPAAGSRSAASTQHPLSCASCGGVPRAACRVSREGAVCEARLLRCTHHDGKVDGEPAEHARGVRRWVDADDRVLVQRALKVARKTVHRASLVRRKAQLPAPSAPVRMCHHAATKQRASVSATATALVEPFLPSLSFVSLCLSLSLSHCLFDSPLLSASLPSFPSLPYGHARRAEGRQRATHRPQATARPNSQTTAQRAHTHAYRLLSGPCVVPLSGLGCSK